MLSKKMEESYEQTVRFYGEDPKRMAPDEFFGIFKEFLASWEKCSIDSREHRLKQERSEKQKKREQERRKRANSNAMKPKRLDGNGGSSGSGIVVEGEEDKAILHSLLDKLKKDTLDVKTRRRSQRQRQRSTSVSIIQPSFSTTVDPIYMRANKMLRSIQTEPSSSLLDDPRLMVNERRLNPTVGGRRMSTSVLHINPTFKPVLMDRETAESPVSGLHENTIRHRRHARPLSAIIIPEVSSSSQSLSTAPVPTRHVRVRKTSTRPIFDHSLRNRARRMSTR